MYLYCLLLKRYEKFWAVKRKRYMHIVGLLYENAKHTKISIDRHVSETISIQGQPSHCLIDHGSLTID